jgi:phosphonate transport system substrate-binding protein
MSGDAPAEYEPDNPFRVNRNISRRPDGPAFTGRRGRTMVMDDAMARSDRSTDTGHGWGSTGVVGTREPVFTWTPSGPAADGRAVLGGVEEREEAGPVDRLRFGTYLASNDATVALYELVTEEVGRRLGLPTELVVETSYESCEKDQNEVCFVCSLPYVSFERRGLDLAVPVAAPVLQGERYGGQPIYFSDVIVHRDSPFASFLDLRGRSWAYNEPLSWSGYGITRYHLVNLRETDGFFREVVEAGFHREAIRMVARRQLDGSAIDSQVLSIELRDHPELAEQVRVVEALGPSTIQPVAVSRRVPDDLREGIRDVLLTMAEDPAVRERLAPALVERFVPMDASSYDDIRMMVEACEAAGFMELR